MQILYTFVIFFIIIYLVYFILIISRKKGLESFKNGKQLEFFKSVYKLDVKKLDIKKFANSLALSNAFIMSLTVSIMELANSLILKILLGFLVLMILMTIIYKILGNTYKKKEGK